MTPEESATVRTPDRIHFFSYETKVSFELPVGWEESEETDGQATYVARRRTPMRTMVVRIHGLGSPADVRSRIADALAGAGTFDVLERTNRDVDGVPAVHQVLRGSAPGIPSPVIEHQTVAQLDDVAWTLVGVADADDAGAAEVFEAAIDSVRFVLL